MVKHDYNYDNVIDILDNAYDNDISILLEEGKLKLELAGNGEISEGLLNQIKNNKERIISFLNSDQGDFENINTTTPKIKSFNKALIENIPLSFSQQRLWFVDKLGGSAHYHISMIESFNKDLDVNALEYALKEVVNRHEILRTVIKEENGIPFQEVLLGNNWNLKLNDLDGKLSSNKLKEIFSKEINKPFNLSVDLMLRATLYQHHDESYTLVLVVHHIAADGWSMNILIDEVLELYQAKIENRPYPLTPVKLQFADYAVWQNKFLDENRLNRKLKYWENQLNGISHINLPLDFIRPKVQSTEGSSLEFDLDIQTAKKIEKACNEAGVTMYMFLLTAFKVLLYKYTGQTDICVVSPLANRTQEELEKSVGFFINTVALRSNLSNTSEFNELLNQVKSITLEANQHQDVPFESVVDRVIDDRDLSMNPLSQIMFVLQNTPKRLNFRKERNGTSANDAIGVQENEFLVRDNYSVSKFDITVNVNASENGIKVVFEYCTDLFKEQTIKEMGQRYIRLISAVLENATATSSLNIEKIQIIDEVESQKILSDFNDTKASFPDDKSAIDMFREQVDLNPNHQAIVLNGTSLTYRDLDEKSNQLACYLKEKGIEKEDIVGICMDRSLQMIIGVLATIKAGGAYVPLDPGNPIDRLRFMIEDSNVKVLLSCANFESKLKDLHDDIILLDTDQNKISEYSAEPLDIELGPNDLMYVIYTSGSTGKPKGVMVEHTSNINMSFDLIKRFNLTKEDKILQFASLAFDASVYEIFKTLYSGATLVLVDKETIDEPPALTRYMIENQVSVATLPPAYLKSLDLEQLSFLRCIVTAGEAANVEDAVFLSQFCEYHNAYGPTECAVCISSYKVDSKTKYGSQIPIGTPLSNLKVYILDENDCICPIGVTGELCVSGVGVARGYLNRPELTEERFGLNPIDQKSSFYRTGDLAKWLPDGNIEYCSRIDDQVKIRGYRVELSEVEWVLNSYDKVKQCTVLAKEDKSGANRLIAYIVSENTFDNKSIQSYLKAKLPRYMVPSFIIEVASIPLTINGKVDKSALPEPQFLPLSNGGYIAPQGQIEKNVEAVWSKFLGIELLGRKDNFFENGGHSLMAIRVVSTIRKEMLVDLETKDIFLYPTIEELANRIESLGITPSLSNGIKAYVKPEKTPLSFSQERLWFIDQQIGSTHYHTPYIQSFNLGLDIGLLEEVLSEIVDRHESLRTVIKQDGGKPYQNVIDGKNWKLDYEGFENTKSTIDFHGLVSSIINEPFDLENDYMLRAKVFKMDEVGFLLVLVIHHISSDGWSIGVLEDEVIELYDAKVKNRKPQIGSLGLQYSDYAIWQKNELKGGHLETKLNYWEDKLKNVSPLDLPLDFPRPSIQSMKGDSIEFELDTSLTDALNQCCKYQNATLFTFLLSAFKILLSRYCNQSDICVGSPVANRSQKELERMIGFFANTIALRSDLSNNPTFVELLSKVQETTLDAISYQDAPFEKVVDRVVTERSLSRTPVFQAMFNLQNRGRNKNTGKSNQRTLEYLAGLEVELLELEKLSQTSRFDITLNAVELNDKIRFNLEYCVDLFQRETIVRMKDHFIQLLVSIVNDPYIGVDDLQILNKSETQKILSGFNLTDKAYPESSTAVDLFQNQVKLNPYKTAVVLNQERLTYLELDQKSNQLARFLITRGGTKGDLISICMDRSLDMVISVLAVLKMGGAYIPLDPHFPNDRLRFMIEDSNSKLLITSSNYNESLNNIHENRVLLDSEWDEISTQSNTPLDVILASDDLMYVIYTSGSTGKPKGVMIEHSGNVNMSLDQIKRFGITRVDNVLQYASFTFDASVSEMFMAFYSGAKLVLIDKNIIEEPKAFIDYMIEQEVSVVTLPPAYLKTLDRDRLSFLRCLITAGEAADVDDANYLSQYVEYHNAYGPTECSVCVSSYKVNQGRNSNDPIPIGTPLANMKVFILDKNNSICPIGIPGELCVSGVGVARGYLNRPDLTEERFVYNLFDNQQRFYRTGDLAKWLPDGNIEYCGRIDDQVKIRGFRIELGEIEAVLMESDAILQTTVQVIDEENENKRLVAYIVSKGEFDKSNIYEYLKTSLPGYMIPAQLVPLDFLPLTSHGKVDKKALPNPDDYRRLDYTAPRNKTEGLISEIWKSLLKLESVSVYDNFFEIGGHSLLAMRVVAAIKERLEIELKVIDLFTSPTIDQLSKKIVGSEHAEMTTPSITVKNVSDNVPLSFSQEFLWFIDKYSGSNHYHMPFVQAFGPGLNVEALQYSINEVLNRHESLRTILKESEGEAQQMLLPKDQWSLDLINLPEDVERATIQKYVSEELSRAFNLYKDYMLRATLYKIGESGYVLVLLMHHIASDGWSVNILTKEILEIYNSRCEGRPHNLNPLKIQYSDYSVWQRNYLQGEVLESKLAYWEKKLEGVQPINLPLDYSRPNIQSTRGKSLGFSLETNVSEGINKFCKEEGVTPYIFLLTIFKVLLYRYSGQKDICVGSSFANRGQKELEDLIGFFVNTVAVRTDLSNNPKFSQLLGQVKETVLEIYTEQDTPIDKVIDKIVTKRDISMNPLFQVLFTLQNAPNEITISGEKNLFKEAIDMSDFIFSELDDTYKYSKFDMTMNVLTDKQGYKVAIEYCTDLFKQSTIERFSKHFQSLISSVLKDKNQAISKLQLLTSEERESLLHDLNLNSIGSNREKPVFDLFKYQVEQTPFKTALVFGNSSYTYRQLYQKVSQCANYLINQEGVRTNDFVGIKMNRNEWSVISLLAILKAGAAYVPIDPGYPVDRIRFIEQDSNCKLILDEKWLEAYEKVENQFEVFGKTRNVAMSDNVYMIYTSGSTGLPKGVPVNNSNLVNYLDWATKAYKGENMSFCFPYFTSLSFDLTQTSILLTLLSGGKLFIENDKDVSVMLKNILANKEINALKLTPAHVQILEKGNRTNIPTFILGGEALLPSHVTKIRTIAPNTKIYNEYGPTEATIGCTYFEVRKLSDDNAISIGKPIANTQIYILDEYNELLPSGIVGELCIGGKGVSKGYFNRPELNKEKFIKNPFSNTVGDTLYKTGDLAKWNDDGTLEFIGRKDDQVKIRGYRIELGEIMGTFNASGLVDQSVVLAKEDHLGNKLLVAYVVPRNDFSKPQLKEFLYSKLPEYMVPGLIVEMKEIPLTNNGKVDRESLLKRDVVALSENPNANPRNEIEEDLILLWKNTLKIDNLGIYDDFFDLGGHSLLAIKLVAKINEAFSINLDITILFDNPTIGALAKVIYEQIENAFPIIVKYNEGVKKPAVFCFHSVGGNALTFFELGKLVGDEHAFYTFQAPGLDGLTPTIPTVEELASVYIQEMLKVDPNGPFYLVGYSFGAKLMAEAAYQLNEKGYQVKHIIVLDSTLPKPETKESNPLLSDEAYLLDWLTKYVQHWDVETTLKLSDLEGKSKEEQLKIVYKDMNDLGVDITKLRLRGRTAVSINNQKVRYNPSWNYKLDFPITVLSLNPHLDYGWRHITSKKVNVHQIPGTHFTILRVPNVQKVAIHIKDILKQS